MSRGGATLLADHPRSPRVDLAAWLGGGVSGRPPPLGGRGIETASCAACTSSTRRAPSIPCSARCPRCFSCLRCSRGCISTWKQRSPRRSASTPAGSRGSTVSVASTSRCIRVSSAGMRSTSGSAPSTGCSAPGASSWYTPHRTRVSMPRPPSGGGRPRHRRRATPRRSTRGLRGWSASTWAPPRDSAPGRPAEIVARAADEQHGAPSGHQMERRIVSRREPQPPRCPTGWIRRIPGRAAASSPARDRARRRSPCTQSTPPARI